MGLSDIVVPNLAANALARERLFYLVLSVVHCVLGELPVLPTLYLTPPHLPLVLCPRQFLAGMVLAAEQALEPKLLGKTLIQKEQSQ